MSDNNSDTSSLAEAHGYSSKNRLNALLKKFHCKFCDKTFATNYSLERHNKTFHDDEGSASDMEDDTDKSMNEDETSMEADTVTDESMSKDEISTEEDSTEESESESSTDQESDVDGNYVTNMFRNLVIDAYCTHKDELDPIINEYEERGKPEKEAIILAILESDKAKKAIRHLFAQNMIDINEQQQHPLFKAIMVKVQNLTNDGFDLNEAITCAVGYRKHAIYNLIKYI